MTMITIINIKEMGHVKLISKTYKCKYEEMKKKYCLIIIPGYDSCFPLFPIV